MPVVNITSWPMDDKRKAEVIKKLHRFLLKWVYQLRWQQLS